MAAKQDLYEVLGVDRKADRDAILKSYRKLARKYHPDLNPGDAAAEERFKEIASAYGVLSDETKRKAYDEFGDLSLEAGFDAEEARKVREQFGSRFGFEGHPGRGPRKDEYHFGGIDDLFGHMFSGEEGGARGMRMRGADVEASLELDFLEAVRGGEKRLTLGRPAADGSVKSETVTIRIPPGVNAKGRLRVPGKGGLGLGGGESGDLWVQIRVRPHHVFGREGRNLTLEVPITVREAILGGSVEVPTLDGRAKVTIPPGTDGGTRLRLRGKGVPGVRDGAAGDLLVRVQIKVPRGLDDEAEAAVEALRSFEDAEIRKGLFE